MRIEVKCYAGLSQYAPESGHVVLGSTPTSPTQATPLDVARALGIQAEEIAVFFVNGANVHPDKVGQTPLHEGDTVGLFPPVGGG